MLEYQDGAAAGYVSATVTTDAASVEQMCEELDVTCIDRITATGDRAAVVRVQPEPGFGVPMDSVMVFRADEVVLVSTWAFGTKGYVNPIDVSDLMAIATDPRISLRIDPEWNRAGERMTEFDERGSVEIFSDSAPNGGSEG